MAQDPKRIVEEPPQEEYEWNLYHDMDNRNYNDVEKIKALEEENKSMKKKLRSMGFMIE